MISELKQALDDYDAGLAAGGMVQENIEPDPIVEAAGLVVLWKEDCQTCEGYGWTEEPSATGTGSFQQPCEVCAGRGWNPTAQAIEVLARRVADRKGVDWADDEYMGAVRRVVSDDLVAVLSMGDTK